MAKEQNPNPTEAFSEMVTQWERNYDAFANQLMGTEGFSQAMNEMQKAQLSYQQVFAQSMTQQLASMNIPSRDDVMSLMDAVTLLGRRLERIEEALGVNQAPKSRQKRPPRTKKPTVAKTKSSKAKKS